MEMILNSSETDDPLVQHIEIGAIKIERNISEDSDSNDEMETQSKRTRIKPDLSKKTAYNYPMADKPDEPIDLTDLPLPSRSNATVETQGTAATPFAEPPTIAAPKSSAQRQLDAEKLIFAVEQRSAIYNLNCKEHSNKNCIDKLWDEIADELKSPVSECKNKWNSLRSAYSRHLREEREKPSAFSGKQKKKWYLSDAMAFLKEYVHQHRSTTSSFQNEDSYVEEIISVDSPVSIASNAHNSPQPSKKLKASEMVVGPMIEFFQSKTKSKVPDNANCLYFKSMLADFENLKPKNQRKFKKTMGDLMLQLQEEEENENSWSAQQVNNYQPQQATMANHKWENYIHLNDNNNTNL